MALWSPLWCLYSCFMSFDTTLGGDTGVTTMVSKWIKGLIKKNP